MTTTSKSFFSHINPNPNPNLFANNLTSQEEPKWDVWETINTFGLNLFSIPFTWIQSFWNLSWYVKILVVVGSFYFLIQIAYTIERIRAERKMKKEKIKEEGIKKKHVSFSEDVPDKEVASIPPIDEGFAPLTNPEENVLARIYELWILPLVYRIQRNRV